jgi:hypothetical protein
LHAVQDRLIRGHCRDALALLSARKLRIIVKGKNGRFRERLFRIQFRSRALCRADLLAVKIQQALDRSLFDEKLLAGQKVRMATSICLARSAFLV